MDCFVASLLAMTVEAVTTMSLPCHLRGTYALAVQLLVVVHVDRHPQQLAGEFERRLVIR